MLYHLVRYLGASADELFDLRVESFDGIANPRVLIGARRHGDRLARRPTHLRRFRVGGRSHSATGRHPATGRNPAAGRHPATGTILN